MSQPTPLPDRPRRPLGPLRHLSIVLPVAALYFVSAKLGLSLAFVHASATAVWPPSGIALAALLLLGYRAWPGIFAGAFLANLTTAGTVATSLGIATGNTLEGVVGCALVNRFAGGRECLDRPANIVRLAFYAGMGSTTVSATCGVASLCLGGFADPPGFGETWFTWWLGDAVGDWAVAPLLLLWAVKPSPRWTGRRLVEASLLLLLLYVAALVVFCGLLPFEPKSYPIAFVCIPILMWAAFRFGPRDAATCVFLLSGIALCGTVQGLGPFSREDPNESLLLLQGFVGTASLMVLGVSAVVAERNRTVQELRLVRSELERRVEERTSSLAEAVRTLQAEVEDRKRAEEGLRASEQRFRAVTDTALDAIVSANARGEITYLNPAAERMFGWRAPDAAGQPLTILMPERFREPHRQGLARYAETAQGRLVGRTFEIAGMRQDGSEFPVEISLAVWRDGGETHFTALISDITERKRVDESLRENQRQLASAQALAHIGSWVWEIGPNRVSWSDEMYRIYGLEPQSVPVTYETFLERLHPDDRETVDRTVRAAHGNGRPFSFDHRVVLPSGVVRWLHGRGDVVRDDGGHPVQMHGTGQDITERKEAQAALQRYSDAVSDLYHNAPCGYHSVDREGVFVRMNDTELKWLGYAREEVIGEKRFTDIVTPEGQALFREQFPIFLEKGRVADLEYEFVRKDGSRFPVLLSATAARDAEGRVVMSRSVVVDVTERRRLEIALRQTQKMDAIGRLASGIAHDFNNVLQIILTVCASMLRGMADADPARANLLKIKRAGERVASLTRQLLAFARRQALRPEVLDLNRVVEEAENLLRPLLGEDIELVTELSPDLWNVTADPGQLEQVLINLVVNARDSMPRGGRIAIATGNADIDALLPPLSADLAPGRYVRLSIQDTGCGMNADTLKHVFEPFFTTKDQGKGTGLGLSTVYGVVRQSGGDVVVRSEPGRGTEFDLYLPRSAVPAAAERPDAGRAPPRRGTETILLVEDEEEIRSELKADLEECGYTVLAAADGEGAITAAAGHAGPIHLLLSDLVLPRGNGQETFLRLRARRPGVKALLMTGHTDHPGLHEALLHLHGNLLRKPFSPETLSERVRQALDSPPAPSTGSRAAGWTNTEAR